jgi:hypothetical protein
MSLNPKFFFYRINKKQNMHQLKALKENKLTNAEIFDSRDLPVLLIQ